MSFEWPLALLGLLVVPLLVAAYVARERRRTTYAARFTTPGLLPNLVDAVPGRRRHLPLAVLLVALTAMVVGVARPHANVNVPREEATVILVLDTSLSMRAEDVRPSRLGAARNAAVAFLRKVPEKFRIGVVGFTGRPYVALPPTADRSLVLPALASLRSGEGTALGDAVVLATKLGRRQRASDGTVPPIAILLISDGAQFSGRTTPDAAARRARALHVPVYTVVVGTPSGVVEVTLTGGFRAQLRVPPRPDTLRQVARTSGGQFFTAATDERLRTVYDRLGSRLGRAPARRGRAVGAVVPEGPLRRSLLLGALLGAAALGPGTSTAAAATNECRGLQICVKVVGPWVVVPARLSAPRTQVEYQLSCPRGFIVGGLDAELSDRAIELAFLGKLGSPVNPGVTTSRDVVFVGTFAGAAARAPSFRPHLGCIPAAGGGAGPVPYAVFPPGEPTVRRVANVPLRPARSARAVRRCVTGERVVSGWHAVGFYSAAPPSAALVAAVTTARTLGSDRVEVRVRTGAALRGVRAVLQVGAVCGGGP